MINMEEKEDYYGDNKTRKWTDLAIGFFGAQFVNSNIVGILYYIIIMIFKFLFKNNNQTIIYLLIGLGAILLIGLNIFIIKKFKKNGREYISKGIIIGIITAILLPLLAFGACMVAFSGFN